MLLRLHRSGTLPAEASIDTPALDALDLNLRQLVDSIAAAVDQVGVDDFYHGRRVGMMAAQLASRVGFDTPTQESLYDAGLLHDCGVSSTKVHRTLVSEFEWEGAQAHCDRGSDLVGGFRPLSHLAPIIRHHHRRWSDLQAMDVGPDVARCANLVFLVDRVDALAAPHYGDRTLLSHVRDVRAAIARHAGTLFSPELVDGFLRCANNEAFWLELAPEYVTRYQDGMASRTSPVHVGWNEFRACARIFADIVDAKSHYTKEHSLCVARLSGYLARKLGLSPPVCDRIEVAGLLHDLGKLQVPDDILESADVLDEVEFSIMKSHSFATYKALKRIGGMDQIAAWAGYHHECLNGSGYPFHKKEGHLPLEARIINVADIFQALAQDRPYRSAMAPAAILSILADRVQRGLTDRRVVRVVADNLAECVNAATKPWPAE